MIFKRLSLLFVVSAIIIAILIFLSNANGLGVNNVLSVLMDNTIEFIFSGMLGSLIFWHLIMKRRIRNKNFHIGSDKLAIGGFFISFFLASSKCGIQLFFGGNFFDSMVAGNDGEVRVLIFFVTISLFVTYILRIKFAEEELTNG
jgi:hypothetical protein